MTAYTPFGSPQNQDADLIYRLAQLETENVALRKRVRRYNRGSWALGILLLLGLVANIYNNLNALS